MKKNNVLKGGLVALFLGGMVTSSEGQIIPGQPLVLEQSSAVMPSFASPPVSDVMARDYNEQNVEASLDSSNTGTEVAWKVVSSAGGVVVGPTAIVARPWIGMSRSFVARKNLLHNAEPQVISRFKEEATKEEIRARPKTEEHK